MDDQKTNDLISRVNSLTRHLNNFQSELVALKHSLVTEPGSQITITDQIAKNWELHEEEIEIGFDQSFMMTKADFGNVTVVEGDVMKQLKNDNE